MRIAPGVCSSAAGGERKRNPRASVTMLRLLPIVFVSCSHLTPADGQDSDRVFELLSTAKTQALELKSDIQSIDFFTGTDFGWESHISIVNEYKNHIGAIRRQATTLDEARSIASPFQKTTIDRIEPLLRDMASAAETLINRINQNPKRLNSAEYKDYIRVNADLASELASLVGNFIDYGRTKQQLEGIADKIDHPVP